MPIDVCGVRNVHIAVTESGKVIKEARGPDKGRVPNATAWDSWLSGPLSATCSLSMRARVLSHFLDPRRSMRALPVEELKQTLPKA
jgi:hypothetical protein